jgi:hypothetical protein
MLLLGTTIQMETLIKASMVSMSNMDRLTGFCVC